MTVVLVILTVVVVGAYIYAIAKPLGDMADGWKVQEDRCRAERLAIEARTQVHLEECDRLKAQIQTTQTKLTETKAEIARVRAHRKGQQEEVEALQRICGAPATGGPGDGDDGPD